MKPKHLIPLAAVLVALILAGTLMKKEGAQPLPLREQGGFVDVLPESVTPTTVTALELVYGEDAEPAVRLVKDVQDWRVASAWNAPAKNDKVKGFLDTLESLQGEWRSDNPDNHADFGVNPAGAVTVRLFAGGAEPAATLLVGKTRGSDAGFVRLASKATVYAVDANLLSEMGIWGGEPKAPERRPWLDTKILTLDQDRIARVDLTYPDHALAFERRAVEAAGEAGTTGSTAPTTTWAVAEGGFGTSLEVDGVRALLTAVSSLDVDNVVDPSKKAEYGLDDPSYRCVLTMDDGTTHTLLAARKAGKSKSKIMLADRPDLVWDCHTYTFENVFKKGNAFFALQPPTLDKEAVLSLRYEQNGKNYRVRRKDAESPWEMSRPVTGFPLRTHRITEALKALGEWKAEDYADPARLEATGFDAPTATLEAEVAAGETKERKLLLRGKDHVALDAAYVAASKEGPVFAVKKGDARNAFPSLESLLNLKLLDFTPEQVSAVTVSLKDGTVFSLRRRAKAGPDDKAEGDGGDDGGEAAKDEAAGDEAIWVIEENGTTRPADTPRVEGYLGNVTKLRGLRLLLGEEGKKAVPPAAKLDTFQFSLDATSVVVEVGEPVEDGRGVRASGRKAVVSASKEDLEPLFKMPADFEPLPEKAASTSATVANPFEEAAGKAKPAGDAPKAAPASEPAQPAKEAPPGAEGSPKAAAPSHDASAKGKKTDPKDNPFLRALQAAQKAKAKGGKEGASPFGAAKPAAGKNPFAAGAKKASAPKGNNPFLEIVKKQKEKREAEKKKAEAEKPDVPQPADGE